VLKILKGEKNDDPVGFLEEIKWTDSCSSSSLFFFFFFFLSISFQNVLQKWSKAIRK
jgi:hypothetical protein